ncbi:ABC transporter permease [Bacillus pseudomycoides]|uniref:ABC transporter permease n=1 Tax=Bacillus pseudomycoides TaxID=64104 RepID=A0ABD6T102_9BACI|nr:FtsX-like permease family protein [Bacillus pseudomycoides]MCR8858624.1 FtsX-like permease family protein [Bacillus pseudomycoides]PEF23726.1 ABC transporter permease [Bacillus pseudomycoides]PEK31808.1 ABC transporter permease [Bacillus pseudomycoides]PEK68514.1 ABC transporter permease [Bacillus pseudomycoides]PEO42050.1 ABC transporter permease [Bacillus pseudomycoides]
MNIRELAFRNVTRNRRTYSAYFLSSAFAIMAFFVYSFFAFHPALSAGQLGQYVFVSMSVAQVIIYLFTFFFILYSMGMFLKTRKRELGILMMLGMTKFQLKRLIFFENVMIGIAAIITGIICGMLFSGILILVAPLLLKLDLSLSYYVPTTAIGVTSIMFFILFIIISFFSAGLIRKNQIMKLFRGSVKAKPEPKASIISSFLAIVLLGAGYIGAVTSHGVMVFIMLIPVTTVVIIGTYLLYKQLSVFIIRACKKSKRFYWTRTNIITLSDLAYRMRDNARMFFIVTIISTVAFSAIGTLVGFASMTKGVMNQPIAFHYYSKQGNENESQHVQAIEQTLKKHKISAEKIDIVSKKTENKPLRDATFVRESDYKKYAKLTGEPVDLLTENAVLFLSIEIPGPPKKERTTIELPNDNKSLQVKKVNTSSLGKVLTGNIYVVSEAQYNLLQDGFKEVKDYMYKTNETKNEIEAGKELTHQIKAYQEYSRFSAAEYDQNQALQFAGPIFFVGFFIGIVFFVCAGSFLYFRLFSDLEEDYRLFDSIRKVGLTSGELAKVVTIRLGLLFFVPIGVATLHGAVALTALGQMFEYSLVKENAIVLSIFVGIQIVYFILIRSRYLKQLKERLRMS